MQVSALAPPSLLGTNRACSRASVHINDRDEIARNTCDEAKQPPVGSCRDK